MMRALCMLTTLPQGRMTGGSGSGGGDGRRLLPSDDHVEDCMDDMACEMVDSIVEW